MEIERKYLIDVLPPNLNDYPFHQIEQAYLCTSPVIRIRRQDDEYILTYKGKGLMIREEYNLPLTAEAYAHLLPKTDGNLLTKKRYVIPLTGKLKIELDVFEGKFSGLKMAEVEFPDEKTANAFTPPDWFGREVTCDPAYHNSNMSQCR
ncbi:MAG: CYTH domain-containing protein [Clostridiales bacterium]|nr:CYTH domain-containing protein [Clostridiales bacterium]